MNDNTPITVEDPFEILKHNANKLRSISYSLPEVDKKVLNESADQLDRMYNLLQSAKSYSIDANIATSNLHCLINQYSDLFANYHK